jgi:hypothetical protein
MNTPVLGPSPTVGDPMSQMMSQMMTMMAILASVLTSSSPLGGPMLPNNGGFGGGAQQGPLGSGVGNFLGGNSGGGNPVSAGSPTSGAGGASAMSSSEMGSATDFGKSLAKDAEKNANGPGGYCYKWVGQALRRHGVNTSGASAYMAADQLAKNPKFKEVKVQPADFKKLPAGAVVVWNKGNGHQHGHISIALGDGREASDKIRNQITNYGTSARVFIPK